MGELRVRGGIGGVTARLEDLDHAATLLRRVAVGLAEVAARVGRAALDPGWTATALFSPAGFAHAEVALARALIGPSGVGPQAARAELLGDGLAGAAHAYRAADAAVAAGFDAARVQLGRSFGPELAAAWLPVLVVGGVVAARGDGGGVWALISDGDAVERSAAVLTGVAEGALGPAGPVLAAGSPNAGDGAALATLLLLGGRLSGGRLLSEPAGAPVVAVRPAPAPTPPRGVADLVARVPSTDEPAPRVRLERIDGPGGRAWVVGVPGTSAWSPRASSDPFDLTGDVRLVAGQRSAGVVGVEAAMRAAGVRPGEPVLLAGHSQGGLIAAAVAADPGARREFSITHVVTSGAPVADVPVPADVQVLSLEHDQDVVPHLDGAPNPDRPGWVTVEADVAADPQVRQLHRSAPLIAHDQEVYRRTAAAVDASPDPSVRAWREHAGLFLGRPGAVVTAFDASVRRP